MTMSGFSLIELMVVAVIIVVMAGMLLPAIQLVRTSAQGTRCNHSLSQFGMAGLSYSIDEDGWLPPNSFYVPPGWKRWYDYLGPYLGKDVALNQRWCPAWGRTDLLNIYAYNCSNAFKSRYNYINGNSSYPLGLQFSRFDGPTNWMWMGEGCVSGYGILESYSFAPWDPNGSAALVHAGSVRLQHRRQSNYLFLDGRVECLSPLLVKPSRGDYWTGLP